MQSQSKYPRLRQLKLEQAIVDGHYRLENRAEQKAPVHLRDVEIILDGETSGIRLDQFLLQNDWDSTVVAISDKSPDKEDDKKDEEENISLYEKISYDEQDAVTKYVSGEDFCTQFKNYFISHQEKVQIQLEPFIYNPNIIQVDLTQLKYDLRDLVCMQSAFNKARSQLKESKETHRKVKVYRDIWSRNMELEIARPNDQRFIENTKDADKDASVVLKKNNNVVQMISVASTARGKDEDLEGPPPLYKRRDVRFVILKDNDAVPLNLIINKEKYPELWKRVLEHERENFLGIRPTFLVRAEDTNLSKIAAESRPKYQYTLKHVTLADMARIKQLQRFYKSRLQKTKMKQERQVADLFDVTKRERQVANLFDTANIENFILARLRKISEAGQQYGREVVSLIDRIPVNKTNDEKESGITASESSFLVKKQIDFLEQEYLKELEKFSKENKPALGFSFWKFDPIKVLNHLKDGNAEKHHYLRVLGLVLRELYQEYPLLTSIHANLSAVKGIVFPKNYQAIFAQMKKTSCLQQGMRDFKNTSRSS